jgi:RNA polymerase subunit RPABC4/transcription elongation factor Spt4
MSMINCSDCGKEMSGQAKTCPSCGAPNKSQSMVKLISWLVVLCLLIFAALAR